MNEFLTATQSISKQMTRQVVLIGHCGPDASYLRMAVSSALRGAKITMVDEQKDLQRALDDGADLLLFNRVLDYGFDTDEGVEMIRKLRQTHPHVKSMLVSNFAEAQQAAIAAGALPGFGKREIGSKRVTELLRDALPD